jgi:CubicO group peptidase (beta-lactamase class C family)
MSSGGLSKARLGRMHEVMAGYVQRDEVPGFVTLVSRRGEVHVDAVGMKKLGGGEPMRRDTIFRISSMTKPITAAAAMILIKECELRLDEPVDRLLPELADRKVLKELDGPLDDTVPANRPITTRDLLPFRMGFGMIMAPPDRYPIQRALGELQLGLGPPSPSTPPAPDEWMRRFGTLPLLHQPGEKWMYNTGSDVLAVLVARASGKPLETFMRERIFDPLGMKDTGFSVPPEKLGRLATSYLTNFETGALEVYDEGAGGQWSRPPAFLSGAGGTGLDDRRLPGVRPDDAGPGKARQRAHPFQTIGRDHDDRPADARAEGGVRFGSGLLRRPWLGVRRFHRHSTR